MRKEVCEDTDCDVSIWVSNGPPSPIVLNGFEITQKGRDLYLVTGAAKDMDRLCWVPQLEADLPNARLATLILAPGADRWQRELDPDRLADIGAFFDNPGNFFVNAVIVSLACEDHTLNVVNGVVRLEVEPTWMRQECQTHQHRHPDGDGDEGVAPWFDRCPIHGCPDHEVELRPALIIDGQHRIRGTQHPNCTGRNPEERLIAVLLPSEVWGRSEQAKIFTEITTSAEDLDPLHKVFLLYKFRLRAPRIQQIADPDFRERDNQRRPVALGLRNRRAYEIACKLCSHSTASPWYDRVTILRKPGGRARRGDTIEITQLIPVLEPWLRPGGVLEDPQQADGMKTAGDAFQDLDNYLRAILVTWSGARFWNVGRGSNGVFQDRGIFWVLVKLFENYGRRMDTRSASRSIQEFQRELDYISQISWGSDWLSMRAPEQDRNLLLRILQHVVNLAPAVTHPMYQPHSGLNAYITQGPEVFSWDAAALAHQGTTLRGALPIEFEWERPPNAYITARFAITQGGVVIYERHTRKTALRLTRVPPNLDTSPNAANLVVQVTYENHRGDRSLTMDMVP